MIIGGGGLKNKPSQSSRKIILKNKIQGKIVLAEHLQHPNP
jgi:hypothetical protein